MPILQIIKNILNSEAAPTETNRHKFLINIFIAIFTLLTLPNLAITIYNNMHILTGILGIYLVFLMILLYLNVKNFLCLSKIVFISISTLLFTALTFYLGSEHGFHRLLLAFVITPNLIFSFKSKREFFISVIFQLIIILSYISLRNYQPFSLYSLTYYQSLYLQHLTDFGQIFLIALQIAYLIYVVNKDERILQSTINEISSYKKALETTSIVAYTDKTGNIIDANENFCQISGYEKKELIGQNHRILKSGYHDQAFYKDMWFTIKSGKIWRGEICNKKKSGDLYWVDSVIAPIYDELNDNLYYLSVRFDITQKKMAEAQLIQTSKMSSLGEMAGGIAHEINTPLGVIQMRADQIMSHTESSESILNREKLHKNAKIIDETVNRIAKIITGLRAFSRNSSADEMTQNCVLNIINETLDLCSQKLKNKDVETEILCGPELMIKCRPTEISQVLLNLISNSVDAVENLKDRWIKIECHQRSNQIEISVTDSGPGIPLDIQSKLMQPFFTTKELGKGTGLGLSISRGIIQSHGGSIEIDNNCPNTRFIIKLPLIIS